MGPAATMLADMHCWAGKAAPGLAVAARTGVRRWLRDKQRHTATRMACTLSLTSLPPGQTWQQRRGGEEKRTQVVTTSSLAVRTQLGPALDLALTSAGILAASPGVWGEEEDSRGLFWAGTCSLGVTDTH